MNIAVIDVAAETSGALSVLNDFIDTLRSGESDSIDEWFIFTSIVSITESKRIHNIQNAGIKKSWFHRLYWEYNVLPRLVKKYKIDIIFSLQNNALPVKGIPQVTYFHNVLLTQREVKFSFLKKDERKYAVYSKILGPYIRHTWKRTNLIIVQGESIKKAVEYYYHGDVQVVRPNQPVRQVISLCPQIKGYIYPATPYVYKNVECLIHSVGILAERNIFPEILLTMTGEENQYAKKIKQMALGLPNIHFIGFLPRNEIVKKYGEYGLIMTSLLESFPVPLLEAMSVGTVIVALDKPYVQDLIEESHYNRLYVAKDVMELADCMVDGAQDKSKSNYVETRGEKTSMREIIDIVRTLKNEGNYLM